MEFLSDPAVWLSLLTLTFMEVVLGIDNIIFISIAANKLPANQQKKAMNIGLFIAMILRVILLFGISFLISLQQPWFHLPEGYGVSGAFSGQSIILIGGGLFLLYKATSEIHHKLEGPTNEQEIDENGKGANSLKSVIVQICIINIVFSLDSIFTAVGMTNSIADPQTALIIMIVAVVLSILIMMLFGAPVGNFVNKHPSIQMLGLSFLILIGFMLIAEGAHMSHFEVAGSKIGAIPKGYLYFAIFFSLGVEMLNMKLRKGYKPVGLKQQIEPQTKS